MDPMQWKRENGTDRRCCSQLQWCQATTRKQKTTPRYRSLIPSLISQLEIDPEEDPDEDEVENEDEEEDEDEDEDEDADDGNNNGDDDDDEEDEEEDDDVSQSFNNVGKKSPLLGYLPERPVDLTYTHVKPWQSLKCDLLWRSIRNSRNCTANQEIKS